MPIHLNLLAEQQAEEEARRHDPVRQAILVAVVVMVLVAIWSLSLQLQIWLANEQLKRENQRWQSMATNYNAVMATVQATEDIQRKLNALQQLTTNRFLVAPALNALQFVTVDDVRLTQLNFYQSFSPDVLKRKVEGKEISVNIAIEKKNLVLKGIVTGNVSVGEKFKTALAEAPYFQSALVKTNGIKWDFAPKPNPQDPASSIGTFTIECFYRPITR